MDFKAPMLFHDFIFFYRNWDIQIIAPLSKRQTMKDMGKFDCYQGPILLV